MKYVPYRRSPRRAIATAGGPAQAWPWGRQRWLPLALILWLALGPGGALVAGAAPPPRAPGQGPGQEQLARRTPFFRLLSSGDSAYAQLQGYKSLAVAVRYYERAAALAASSHDTLLLAEATFATGRLYDAWNKQPARTVAYFQRAAALFGRLPAALAADRYYYARYLVVHALDKVPDTTGTVRAARTLYGELRRLPPARLQRIPTTVELAWSCTEVGAYALADSVLRHLTRRPWIRNDPATYAHLTHYYLVQARLDAYYRPPGGPKAHLDSLTAAYQGLTNLFDREYYSAALAPLLAAAGNWPGAYQCLRESTVFKARLADQANVPRLRLALLRAEQRADRARRQRAREQQQRQWGTLAVLGLGLGVSAALSATLFRQRQTSRRQAAALAVAIHQLDDKVGQVELLNKEIQHRVKNNLHMVFSLLQMQEWQSDNDEVIANLQAARLRVESVAALHNQLLANPEGLDLGRYLRELISAVVACLANDRQVVTHLHTEALHLPPNACFALSLMLNEWVTNSIKYAHVGHGGVLEITVAMRTTPHEICLTYADNGAPGGPPATAHPMGSRARTLASSGLGTEIIQLLTRQLRARLRTLHNHPYHYELCIPRAAAA